VVGDKQKLQVNEEDRTNVDNIYCIGDCAEGRPELTPTAIMAGTLFAIRLFSGEYKGPSSSSSSSSSSSISSSTSSSTSKKFNSLLMNYSVVPTTVFTPLEYGCVGLSEEKAIEKHGKDGIEVYHAYYQPLQFTVPKEHHPDNQCFSKIICLKSKTGEKGEEKVLGIHVIGPHSGEVIQGFVVALKKGITKSDIDSTVGIHPTVAEELTLISITKSSGVSAKKTGC